MGGPGEYEELDHSGGVLGRNCVFCSGVGGGKRETSRYKGDAMAAEVSAMCYGAFIGG